MHTKDFKVGKEDKGGGTRIKPSQEDEQALDVVQNVLESYGGLDDRMMIGGIIDCAARQKMGVVTGDAIGRLVAAGRLKRDDQYVWLPDQDDVSRPADPVQMKKVLAKAANDLAMVWRRASDAD